MKKTSLFISGFTLLCILGYASCAYELYDETKVKPATGNRQEYLALLKAVGEYTISEEKLENMITGLLNPMPEGRNAVINETIKISGSKKLTIKKHKTSAARSMSEEHDSTDVYMFSTVDTGTGMGGYVLASTDMRIGNVLAVVAGNTLDEEEDWFTNIIINGLAGYIERTVSQYNSISEEEIRQTLENPPLRTDLTLRSTGNGTTNLIAPGTGLMHHWYPGSPDVIAASWSWTDGYEARLPVNWHQGSPYNYYVCRSRNGASNSYLDDYAAGCGPVAVALIMAYHGWPLNCTLNVTIPNVNMNIYNYPYNWTSMRNDFSGIGATDPITGGAKDAAVLMYEIGHPQRANADYVHHVGTYSYPNDLITAFRNMGYTTPSDFIPYDYGTVKASIMASRPVLMVGWDGVTGGHFWVVDEVRHMFYAEHLANDLIWCWDWDFVHCNTGWGSGAWYQSGFFDFRYPTLARNNANGYYQYSVHILPNVYH